MGTIIFCFQHHPKPSQLSSGRQSEFEAIVEGIEEDLTRSSDPGDVRIALEDGAEQIDNFIEGLEEAKQSLEDGLGHSTAQTENMEQTIRDLQDFKSEIDTLKDEIDMTEEHDPDEWADREWDSEARDKLAEAPEILVTA